MIHLQSLPGKQTANNMRRLGTLCVAIVILLANAKSTLGTSSGMLLDSILDLYHCGRCVSEIPFSTAGTMTIRIPEEDLLEHEAAVALASNNDRMMRLTTSDFVECDGEGKNGIVVDVTGDLPYLSDINATRNFRSCYWILNGVPRNLQLLRQAEPAYDSRVFTAFRSSDGILSLKEFYTISPGSNVIERTVESWKGSGKNIRRIKSPPGKYIWKRRADLAGTLFNAGIIDSNPMAVIPADGNMAEVSGYFIDLVRSLREVMNFTLALRAPADGSFGRENATTGRWSGLVGMLHRNEVDFSVMGIRVTEARSAAVDYMRTIIETRNLFALRKSGAAELSSFLSLLAPGVWAAMAAVMIVFSVAGALIGHLGSCSDLPELVLAVCGVIVGQGHDERVRRTSMRLIVYSALLFGFIAVQVLSARQAARLAVSVETRRIESVSDIHEKGLNLYVLGNSATLDGFAAAPAGSVERRIYEEQISKDPARFSPSTTAKVFENTMADPDGVLLSKPQTISYWIADNPGVGCSLELLPRTLRHRSAWPARKGWPLVEAINYHLTKFEESGLLWRLRNKWVEPVDKSYDYTCNSEETSELEGIEFSDVMEMFRLLGVGLAAGLAAFAAEKLLRTVRPA